MIIDHIGLAVSDYERSKRFFTEALAPLRIDKIQTRFASTTNELPPCGLPKSIGQLHIRPQRDGKISRL